MIVLHKFHQEIIIDAGSLTGDTSFRQNTKACRTAMAFEEQFSTGNF